MPQERSALSSSLVKSGKHVPVSWLPIIPFFFGMHRLSNWWLSISLSQDFDSGSARRSAPYYRVSVWSGQKAATVHLARGTTSKFKPIFYDHQFAEFNFCYCWVIYYHFLHGHCSSEMMADSTRARECSIRLPNGEAVIGLQIVLASTLSPPLLTTVHASRSSLTHCHPCSSARC